jgi:hypothetical protein
MGRCNARLFSVGNFSWLTAGDELGPFSLVSHLFYRDSNRDRCPGLLRQGVPSSDFTDVSASERQKLYQMPIVMAR